MKVSKKDVKKLISTLESTVATVELDHRVSEMYQRGFNFAIALAVKGINKKILNK